MCRYLQLVSLEVTYSLDEVFTINSNGKSNFSLIAYQAGESIGQCQIDLDLLLNGHVRGHLLASLPDRTNLPYFQTTKQNLSGDEPKFGFWLSSYNLKMISFILCERQF